MQYIVKIEDRHIDAYRAAFSTRVDWRNPHRCAAELALDELYPDSEFRVSLWDVYTRHRSNGSYAREVAPLSDEMKIWIRRCDDWVANRSNERPLPITFTFDDYREDS